MKAIYTYEGESTTVQHHYFSMNKGQPDEAEVDIPFFLVLPPKEGFKHNKRYVMQSLKMVSSPTEMRKWAHYPDSEWEFLGDQIFPEGSIRKSFFVLKIRFRQYYGR
jgi:hypothetical protein